MFRTESWMEHKEAAYREEETGSISVPAAAAALSCQSFISQVSCMLEASLKAALLQPLSRDKCVTLWNCIKPL